MKHFSTPLVTEAEERRKKERKKKKKKYIILIRGSSRSIDMLGVTGTRQARLGLAPKPTARMSDARDRRGRLVRSRAFNESKNFFGGNGDEFFENEWSASLNHEKEPEEIIHIFTRELDIVTLGPRRGKLIGEEFESNFGTLEGPLPSVEEQGLCIGATFGIKAFSVDPSRQISVLGFCR